MSNVTDVVAGLISAQFEDGFILARPYEYFKALGEAALYMAAYFRDNLDSSENFNYDEFLNKCLPRK
jgi:hypothetical protein